MPLSPSGMGMLRVYVASSMDNIPAVRLLNREITTRGHAITYDWTTHGPAWKAEAARADNYRAMRAVCEAELGGVAVSDAVIVLQKGGRGTHVELGAALALGRPVLIVGEEQKHFPGKPCAFYAHPFVKVIGDFPPHLIVDELESWAWQRPPGTVVMDPDRFRGA